MGSRLRAHRSRAMEQRDFFVAMAAVNASMSSLRKHGPITTGGRHCAKWSPRRVYNKHLWLWVPARAEPVTGPRFARTRWLGRDDSSDGGSELRLVALVDHRLRLGLAERGLVVDHFGDAGET